MNKLLALLLLFSASYGVSQEDSPDGDQYWEKLEVHLVTLGRNEVIYTGGGHSLLRVIDPVKQTDMMYNWGVFDFKDPSFIYKFYEGSLLYRMQGSDFRRNLEFIRKYMTRSFVEEKIDLTVAQKKRVMEKIEYWLKPENNKYLYHFYKNNCSTQVRDILDYALGGQIKKNHFMEMGHTSPRGHWQKSYAFWPELIILTDLIFNSRVDYTLNKWQEMFSPALLREHLKQLGTVSDDGVISEKNLLLSASEDLIEYETPVPSRFSGHQWFALIFGGLLLVAGLFLFGKKEKPGLIVLGVCSLFWGIVSVSYGTLIPITSVLSTREYFQWSVNLFFLWPIDFVFIYASCWWLRGKRLPYDEKTIFSKWLPLLVRAHLIGVAFFIFDYVFSISGTNSFHNLIYVIPLISIFWGLVITSESNEQPNS
jgi:hypothetical protein